MRTIAERVASLETTMCHTKDTCDRIEQTQRADTAEIYAKLNHISSQIASVNTKVAVDKAESKSEKKANEKWTAAIFGGGFSILVVLVEKLLQYFK